MNFETDKERAFSAPDLLALCAVLFLLVPIVFPALGRTRDNNSLTQCMNNLRQLTSAWSMYSPQNSDRLVYSYPNMSVPNVYTNTNTWCWGNASVGAAGSYIYSGSDPAGIEHGDLWPYVRTLSPYKCPADRRIAYQVAPPFKNQPILRSYSINSYLAGMTYGTAYDVAITNLSIIDRCNYKLFVKQSDISRPANTFVLIEEDALTIKGGMFIVDMSIPSTRSGAHALPSRNHANSYPLTFADGHVETRRLVDNDSLTDSVYSTFNGGTNDWAALTNIATVPNR